MVVEFDANRPCITPFEQVHWMWGNSKVWRLSKICSTFLFLEKQPEQATCSGCLLKSSRLCSCCLNLWWLLLLSEMALNTAKLQLEGSRTTKVLCQRASISCLGDLFCAVIGNQPALPGLQFKICLVFHRWLPLYFLQLTNQTLWPSSVLKYSACPQLCALGNSTSRASCAWFLDDGYS